MATTTTPSPHAIVDEPAQVAAPSPKPHRRRWRRLLAVLAMLVALALLGTALLLVSVPSVADAPELVAAELLRHGDPAVTSPPPRVADAVVAIEDQAFRNPPGVDIAFGIARYVVARLLGRQHQGGSTIAQQLAKRLYTGPGGGFLTHVEQVGLALKLELADSHRAIMTMYLNDDYFGDGAYGVRAAAERYFGRSPDELTWAQASLLAGLLQAPSLDDPLVHPRRALARRTQVIAQLRSMGVLSASAARRADRAPLLPSRGSNSH